MNFKETFELLMEKYENALKFLQDPENKEKTWKKLKEDFQADGGIVLGSGVFATTFFHPSWSYVLKTFFADSCYLKFVRFAARNPHPCYPRFFGREQKLVPHFKRYVAEEYIYAIRMEKLIPIPVELKGRFGEFEELLSYLSNNNADQFMHDSYFEDYIQGKEDKLWKLIEAYRQISHISVGNECNIDLHMGNIMYRPSDQNFVITDPFSEARHNTRRLNQGKTLEDLHTKLQQTNLPTILKGGETIPKKHFRLLKQK